MMRNLLVSAIVFALLPVAVSAEPMLPVVGSLGAGWHPIGAPADGTLLADPINAPTATRNDAYWAGNSYDRRDVPPSGSTACGAGALVMGFPCPYSLDGVLGLKPAASPATPGQELYYWGLAPGQGLIEPNFNADPSFYFSGLIDLDLRILSELTSWKDGVEIGWYVKDNPNATTVLIGGPTGIPKDAFGNYDLGGTTVVTLDGDFGFYYRNYERGVTFYTQSELNQFISPGVVAPYLAGFGGFGPNGIHLDDEFAVTMFDPSLYQQWALFGQGDRLWMGLEDIFGPTSPCVGNVPCSDYDFNDFIVGAQIRTTVPEPASLTMLALGLLGAGMAIRRRAAR